MKSGAYYPALPTSSPSGSADHSASEDYYFIIIAVRIGFRPIRVRAAMCKASRE